MKKITGIIIAIMLLSGCANTTHPDSYLYITPIEVIHETSGPISHDIVPIIRILAR